MKKALFASMDISEYIPLDLIRISPLSASLNYGHAIFESLSLIRDGKRISMFHPWLNMERMHRGAEAVGLSMDGYKDDAIIEGIFRLAAANGLHRKASGMPLIRRAGKMVGRFHVRPLLYVESEEISLSSPSQTKLLTIMSPVGECAGKTDGIGIEAMVYPFPKSSPFPSIKTASNYQLSILARKKTGYFNLINGTGCAETLFTNQAGNLVEGSEENIILVNDNELISPPASDGPVPGLAMRFVSNAARKLGMGFRLASFGLKDIADADGLFLCGNTSGIVPISTVIEADGRFMERSRHEISKRPCCAIRRLMHEYEMMEIGQGEYSRHHSSMDEWVDESQRERIFSMAAGILRSMRVPSKSESFSIGSRYQELQGRASSKGSADPLGMDSFYGSVGAP